MYPSGDVREILYGTYNPLSEDCLSEELCAQQLTMTETVTPQFDPYYNIRYSHPETSRRVKYLKKLIHNAAIDACLTSLSMSGPYCTCYPIPSKSESRAFS